MNGAAPSGGLQTAQTATSVERDSAPGSRAFQGALDDAEATSAERQRADDATQRQRTQDDATRERQRAWNDAASEAERQRADDATQRQRTQDDAMRERQRAWNDAASEAERQRADDATQRQRTQDDTVTDRQRAREDAAAMKDSARARDDAAARNDQRVRDDADAATQRERARDDAEAQGVDASATTHDGAEPSANGRQRTQDEVHPAAREGRRSQNDRAVRGADPTKTSQNPRAAAETERARDRRAGLRGERLNASRGDAGAPFTVPSHSAAQGRPMRHGSPEADAPRARHPAESSATARAAVAQRAQRSPSPSTRFPAPQASPQGEREHVGFAVAASSAHAPAAASAPVLSPSPVTPGAPAALPRAVDASQTLLQLAMADSSLTVDVHRQVVNVALTTEATGALELELRLHDGRAHVMVSGPSAPLMTQHAPALREVLAQQGLSLGEFGTSQEQRHPAERTERDAPTVPPTTAPAGVTAPSRSRRHEGRIDVEA